MVVKFTFQSVFGNSRQNPRHFSARGREESLELYSILWSDRPTSKQKVLRHGNSFAARVRRRYFSDGEKRGLEIRLLFTGWEQANISKKTLPCNHACYLKELCHDDIAVSGQFFAELIIYCLVPMHMQRYEEDIKQILSGRTKKWLFS